jgi:hypothetical protein
MLYSLFQDQQDSLFGGMADGGFIHPMFHSLTFRFGIAGNVVTPLVELNFFGPYRIWLIPNVEVTGTTPRLDFIGHHSRRYTGKALHQLAFSESGEVSLLTERWEVINLTVGTWQDSARKWRVAESVEGLWRNMANRIAGSEFVSREVLSIDDALAEFDIDHTLTNLDTDHLIVTGIQWVGGVSAHLQLGFNETYVLKVFGGGDTPMFSTDPTALVGEVLRRLRFEENGEVVVDTYRGSLTVERFDGGSGEPLYLVDEGTLGFWIGIRPRVTGVRFTEL